MSGTQAVIEQIKAEGVTHILTIPGEHNLPLCDMLLDYPELSLITARTEQGLTYMSNGYSRISHTIALPIVISGPGVTHSLSALADAYQDSVPMVLIVTQAPLDQIGKGAFHEIKDQSAAISSIVKWYTRVHCIAEISTAIHHAFLNAFENRPGPTVVEIPLDILTQKEHAEIYSSTSPSLSAPDHFSIVKAAQLLINAEKPVVYAGRGAVISSCENELKKLVEWLESPCFTTALAKGVLPDNHYLNISWGGCKYGKVKSFLQQADVALVIGSSLDDSDAGRFSLSFPDQLIQIDITNENMNREYSVSVALTGDAKTILTQLLSVIKQYPKQSNVSRHDTIADDKQKAIKEKQSTLAWQYMNAIQNAISQQTIIFSDPTWVNGWAVYFLERQFPNTFHCTRNFCGLGFSFPAALGARLAYPNSQVMAIIGDGGFLFSQAELATAVQYQLNIITIIFNDQGFGAIKRRQHNAYKRTVGVDLPSPDFVKMAEAFGAIGIRLTTPDQLYTYLTNAWNYKKPVIIEIPLDNNDPGINI